MRAAFALPAFRRLLGAYAISQLGDWAAEVALAVLVYGLTRDPGAVAATWLVHRSCSASARLCWSPAPSVAILGFSSQPSR